jgi:AmiR/NasT family two-component response regulator
VPCRPGIEQAKGMLRAELRIPPAEAFHRLSRFSQDTNQRVRKISADLVQGRISPAEFGPPPGFQGPPDS